MACLLPFGNCLGKVIFSLVLLQVVRKLSANGENIAIHERVPLGSVIHLFPRYGYLSLSMRVVPRNDSMSWVFLEPIRRVLEESTIKVEESRFSFSDNHSGFDAQFHIDICEDAGQLLQAFFKRFQIQGLEKPWQAFSGGWRTPSISKYFGVDPNFLVGDYRFAFIQTLLVKNSGKITILPNITATDEYKQIIENFGLDPDGNMYAFANDVGTHFIKSYLSGNALYQVIVFDAEGFDAIKRRLSEYLSLAEKEALLSQLPELLPLWGLQLGRLLVLNASPEKTLQVQDLLRKETFTNVTIPNIFKLHNNKNLTYQIADLLIDEPNALLGMDLNTIDVLFENRRQRKSFVQRLKHSLQLWENNM